METEYEVKKLKELVKKLERQNQHLRSKTGRLGPGQQGKLNEVQIPAISDCNVNFDELDRIKGSAQGHRLFASEEFDATLESWLQHDLVHPQIISFINARNEIIKRLDVAGNYTSLIMASTPSKPMKDTLSRAGTTGCDSQEEIADCPNPSASPPVFVHHMPLPSHTKTSAYGLFKNTTYSTVSNGLNNPPNSHYTTDEKVDQSSHRSPTPSSPINQSLLLAKGRARDNHNVQLLKNSPAERMPGPNRDIAPHGGRAIPTLSRSSPRRTKGPAGPSERRVAHSNTPAVASEQSPQMVYSGTGSHTDILGKPSITSPSRVPLPRPSHSVICAYSTPGSKYDSGRSSTPNHHPRLPETRNGNGDVWEDGEFF